MEIKIQELRAGNLVSFKNAELNICKVDSIFITHFRAVNIETGIDYGDSLRTNYQPIQLTEEVLLSCGAKETESYTYEFTQIGKDIDLCVKFCEYDICVTIWQNDPIYLRYDFIDFYLHTLQNLIFALTGEELTYNHS